MIVPNVTIVPGGPHLNSRSLSVEEGRMLRRGRQRQARRQGRHSALYLLAQALLLLLAMVIIMGLLQIGFALKTPGTYIFYAVLMVLSVPPFYLLWRSPPEHDSLRWQLWGPYAFVLPILSIGLAVYNLVWETNQTPAYGLPGFFGFVVQMVATFGLWFSLLAMQAKAIMTRERRLQAERQPLEFQIWGPAPFMEHADEYEEPEED